MSATSASPLVSVVIPTWNRRELLPVVLEPLLAEPDAHEVVVVVDGCVDGSFELLQEMAARDPRVRPLMIENRGMGGARIAGAQAAGGEVVLLLDDDVVVSRGTVAGHARHHARERALVVVGAMPVAGGPQRGPDDFARAIYAQEYARHCRAWLADPACVLRSMWAGHLSLRRADLLALEPPPAPDLARGYHSDIDFGLRCERAGLRGVFDPLLRARHLYSRDAEAFVRDARSSGESLALIHTVHARDLGPLTNDFALAGLPAPARALVRRARSRRWPVDLLSLLVPALGGVGLYRAQRFAAGLRWRVEQERAVRRTVRARAAQAAAA